jgi:hypothetical protein
MSKSKNETKYEINEQSSSNWNLAIILVSVFLSVIAGVIMYAVKSNDKTLNLKPSKIALIIIGIIDLILLIVVVIFIVSLMSYTPRYY